MPQLYVHVSRAESIAALDRGNTSDPYCILSTGNDSKKTQVIRRTCNPEWDEHFIFQHDFTGAEVLAITLRDKDIYNEDDFAGEVIIQLNILRDGPVSKWFPIQQKTGKIFLELCWVVDGVNPLYVIEDISDAVSVGSNGSQGSSTTPPRRLRTHSSSSIGSASKKNGKRAALKNRIARLGKRLPLSLAGHIVGETASDDEGADDDTELETSENTLSILKSGPMVVFDNNKSALSSSLSVFNKKPTSAYLVALQGLDELYCFPDKAQGQAFVCGTGAPKRSFDISKLSVRRTFVPERKKRTGPSRVPAIALCAPDTYQELAWVYSATSESETDGWFDMLRFMHKDTVGNSKSLGERKTSSENNDGGMGELNNCILESALMYRRKINHCVLESDRMVVFKNQAQARTSPQSGWPLLLNQVVQISTKSDTILELYINTDEAKLLQSSPKIVRQYYDSTDSRFVRNRQKYVFSARSKTLRDYWQRELTRLQRDAFNAAKIWNALRSGESSWAIQLLNKGVPVDDNNTDPETMLLPGQFAVQNCSDATVIEKLLGAFPECASRFLTNGDTLLHMVCRRDPIDLATAAVVLEAYPAAATLRSSESTNQDTPLHLAARARNVEVCDLILRHSPSAARISNSEQELPLHVALRQASDPGGSSQHAGQSTSSLGNLCSKLLSLDPHSAHAPNRHLEFPLHIAAQHHSLLVVKELAMANTSAAQRPNALGELPIHVACRRATQYDGVGDTLSIVAFLRDLYPVGYETPNAAQITPEALLTNNLRELLPDRRPIEPRVVVKPVAKSLVPVRSVAEPKQVDVSVFAWLVGCCGGQFRKIPVPVPSHVIRGATAVAEKEKGLVDGCKEPQLPHQSSGQSASSNENPFAPMTFKISPPVPQKRILEPAIDITPDTASTIVSRFDPKASKVDPPAAVFTPIIRSPPEQQQVQVQVQVQVQKPAGLSFLTGARMPDMQEMVVDQGKLDQQDSEQIMHMLSEYNKWAKILLKDMQEISDMTDEQHELQLQVESMVNESDEMVAESLANVELGVEQTNKALELNKNWLSIFPSKSGVKNNILKNAVISRASAATGM